MSSRAQVTAALPAWAAARGPTGRGGSDWLDRRAIQKAAGSLG
jgi:hypothetical protein